jgi:hypothetical protein
MPTANAAVCAHVFLLLVLVAVPRVALAGDPPKNDAATAHALFYEGRTLMQQNRFADACPKLEESMRLRPGLGTEFNLADCNEHLGKVTSAWAGFLAVAAAAKAENQPEREKVARKRAQALDARLPKLVIEVSASPAFVEVKRDGIDIGSAAWGVAVPVDPGTHRVSATASGKGTWETTITASEGKTVRVSVPRELPPPPSVAAAPARVGGSPPVQSEAFTTTTTTAASDFPAPIIERNGDAQRTVGWIVGSAGVVGLGVGAGFALSSLGKRNDARSHCAGNQCDAAGVGLRDDAIRNGNVATVATIVGGAAVAGGVVLVLTAPRSPESQGRAGAIRAVPNVAVDGGGVLVQGSFQ